MRDLLLHAQAELSDALRMVEAALRLSSLERAASMAHQADLKALAAADTLSRAFSAAEVHAPPRRPTEWTPNAGWGQDAAADQWRGCI